MNASGVNVSATDNRTVTTLARATQGGAAPGSPNPTKGQQTLTNYGAKTPDGSVNIAGAVAVTDLTGDANASVSGGTLTSSSAPLKVTATAANHPTTTADGSPASGAAGTGVGVAVAIGKTSANSLASLGGTTSVTAPAVNVSSTMPATVGSRDAGEPVPGRRDVGPERRRRRRGRLAGHRRDQRPWPAPSSRPAQTSMSTGQT